MTGASLQDQEDRAQSGPDLGCVAGDAGFAEAFKGLARAASGGAPAPRLQALILVAVNCAVTHPREPALRAAIRDAPRHGATEAEVREVLQLVSVLGIHASSICVSALLDGLQIAGQPFDREALLTPEQARIKAAFTAGRGRLSDRWEALLRLDPACFEAYTRFSSHPWQTGTLTPKEREFIHIAIDRATTHLFDPGLRVHIRNAMSQGATTAEMLEAMKLMSLMGIQSDGVGGRILAEEADKQEMLEGERQ